MLTVSPDVVVDVEPACNADAADPLGVDPECEAARLAPGLHVCTDRDGKVVTAGKSCWRSARSQVNPEAAGGRCGRCNERIRQPGAAGELCWWCLDELERRSQLNRVCAEVCFWQRPGEPHTAACQAAASAYDGFMVTGGHEADGPVAA